VTPHEEADAALRVAIAEGCVCPVLVQASEHGAICMHELWCPSARVHEGPLPGWAWPRSEPAA
jgi:hypothetical protein